MYLLAVIALHPSAPEASRILVAERLDQFRTRKSADALLSALDNPELLGEMRVRAGTLLAGLGDRRARRCLELLARSAFGPAAWIRATGRLGKIAPENGCRALEELVTDTAVGVASRVWALEMLCRSHPRRPRQVLPDVAADTTQLTPVRIRALTLTRDRLFPETNAAHQAIAAARNTSLGVRFGAVQVLKHRGGAVVLGLLERLARELTPYPQTKVLIALAELRHAPAAAVARDNVSSPEVPMRNKFEMLQVLAGSRSESCARVVRDVSLGAVPCDLLRDQCRAARGGARTRPPQGQSRLTARRLPCRARRWTGAAALHPLR
ncbi:hypothetical protein ABTZ78_28720 [Streptomyces bauhiniae]|uniref:hypothetical protein n=1 Tax=Streptomyces bauhiniae TaxID=2340725 RepID=UPI0033311B5B